MKNPTYLQMILSSALLIFGMAINSWILRFILIVIVILLIILQFKYDKQLYDKCQLIDDAEVCKKEAEKIKNDAEKLREEYNNKIHSVDEKTKSIIEDCKKEIKTIANEANKKATKLDAEINKLQEEYNKLNGEYMYEISKFIISDNITSEEYKSKYNLSVLREKDIIKNGRAVNIDLYDKLELKKQIENDAKQLLRCFNSETASILLALTVKNIDSSKNKIMRCFETLNKLFTTDKVSLSKEILEIKLEQADLMYAYQYQKEQERLQQKAIREQMVEEEKVRREIEKEKAKIEKEEKQFQNEIAKLMGYMQKSNEAEKQLYIDKIRELEDKLKKVEADKENVLEREQNTRAGYVYVISNIGSFGDDVYKIGMTRRLEPMDRVKELGDASVPFEFDVHAMIFSEDAPALETILHNTFKNNQVNKVNPRKEFFKVKLDDIEKVVKENFNATVTFTKVAEAAQYRESLRIDKEYVAV
ncbi:DUF4041 domain-containing protein [Porcipelethomonas sp.]|uniref:DUF4041 domain-containing protein n=1 Tax=Porcipelethomonas sp. TaxID=2981675 RepID=UPI003077714D